MLTTVDGYGEKGTLVKGNHCHCCCCNSVSSNSSTRAAAATWLGTLGADPSALFTFPPCAPPPPTYTHTYIYFGHRTMSALTKVPGVEGISIPLAIFTPTPPLPGFYGWAGEAQAALAMPNTPGLWGRAILEPPLN